jgi:hypothetical protein
VLKAQNYAETTASSYANALLAANAAMNGNASTIDAVAVQVGTGVYVFFDDDGAGASADSVVFLANTTLLQVSEADIQVVAKGGVWSATPV